MTTVRRPDPRSTQTARAVWAAVSRDPQRRTRQIAADLGIGHVAVARALKRLRRLGYIRFRSGTAGARTVVVPFIVAKREP